MSTVAIPEEAKQFLAWLEQQPPTRRFMVDDGNLYGEEPDTEDRNPVCPIASWAYEHGARSGYVGLSSYKFSTDFPSADVDPYNYSRSTSCPDWAYAAQTRWMDFCESGYDEDTDDDLKYELTANQVIHLFHEALDRLEEEQSEEDEDDDY